MRRRTHRCRAWSRARTCRRRVASVVWSFWRRAAGSLAFPPAVAGSKSHWRTALRSPAAGPKAAGLHPATLDAADRGQHLHAHQFAEAGHPSAAAFLTTADIRLQETPDAQGSNVELVFEIDPTATSVMPQPSASNL